MKHTLEVATPHQKIKNSQTDNSQCVNYIALNKNSNMVTLNHTQNMLMQHKKKQQNTHA